MDQFDITAVPAQPYIDHYRKQAKKLLAACRKGDALAIGRVRDHHPHPDKLGESGAEITLVEVQVVIAREHGFLSWQKFAKFIEDAARFQAATSSFELAVDAIVEGDLDSLRKLLSSRRDLVRARSERTHQATLLHYVGANGVENYRQKTPSNAPEILHELLGAGAEVDAVAEMYGGSTTLGLVATSVHPVTAGVQSQLMLELIKHGANVNGMQGGRERQISIVLACLYNGRGPAARLLAENGANLNLESAAGVGDLERVRYYFDVKGNLTNGANERQVADGLKWACAYGYPQVAEFLLDHGADISDGLGRGMTALHHATMAAQLATVQLLISRTAPLEAVNTYGATPLGQGIWSAQNDRQGTDYAPVLRALVEAGARTDAYPSMREHLDRLLA